MLGKLKYFHFIGIGGIGMSGIAELLHNWGYTITGSDTRYSDNIARLEKSGIRVFIGHDRKNLNDADAVVYTSAVSADNPELLKAREFGIPAVKRAKILAEILRARPNSIAVSGTHGKTTTTSLVGHIFTEAGRDPIIISGGVIKGLNTNVRIGSGDTIIVEADEYDHSFLQLYPTHILITTIDEEHLEIYGNMANLIKDFAQFANRIPFYGKVIVNLDDTHNRSLLPVLTVPVETYSLNESTSINARNLILYHSESSFDVFQHNEILGNVHLPIPGRHNIQNALAAISISLEYDIDFDTIKQAIVSFGGVQRRFEIVFQNDNLMLVDDYAHHPSEIKATLSAAKQGWNRRVIAIFQPHLYSRTQALYKQFAEELELADIIVILDIYPAREKPIPGVSSQLIEDILRIKGIPDIYSIHKLSEIPALIHSLYIPGDMIITLGAGDVNSILSDIQTEIIDGD